MLRGPDGKVHAVVFTEDGRLLTAGDHGGIQAWLVSNDELLRLARERVGR